MSREVARRIASSLLVLLVARAEDCRAQIVIDAHRHHLGTAGRPEWREYAGSTPGGQSLPRAKAWSCDSKDGPTRPRRPC
jgi:hypothetical protein